MKPATTNLNPARFPCALLLTALALLVTSIPGLAQKSDLALEFAPAQTTIHFTLGDILHTVAGAFNLKSGTVYFNPATGAIHGEILVDATSGNSGNSSRDGKMHKEILESARYREITFLPDRVEGKLEPRGKSTIQVHGMFGIHGAEHEITIPVQVEMASDRWAAAAHFAIPYVQWGMKNPSTFILRVSQTVEIDVHATGPIPAGKQ
jgi:polyisoprenoid-binding protein YceI